MSSDAEAALIEYRDIRPGGSLISSWACVPGFESGRDYSQSGPGM